MPIDEALDTMAADIDKKLSEAGLG
jgi:hypothetical protein